MSMYQTEVVATMELPNFERPGFAQLKVEFWTHSREEFLAVLGEAWDKLHDS